MSNKPFQFNNVVIEQMQVHLPEEELTSAELEDRLSPLYERLKIPFGTLERLSGVKSRRVWSRETLPSEKATVVAKQALEAADPSLREPGILLNCSVARDYFEPATACLVHRNLGLPETTMAFDVTNACIGFSNGLLMAANMIERGISKSALVVSAEPVTPILESTVNHLRSNTVIQRDELLKVLPTLTLGCGSAAFLLSHKQHSKGGPRLIGGLARSATSHADLCAGNADFNTAGGVNSNPMMVTESAKLMAAAAKLGSRMFKAFSEAFGWTKESIAHIFCHQVGKQVNEGFYNEMGLDHTKEFTIYKSLGNLVSAALPTALTIGSREKQMLKGDQVLLTAYGSGLNSIFLGIEWS